MVYICEELYILYDIPITTTSFFDPVSENIFARTFETRPHSFSIEHNQPLL